MQPRIDGMLLIHNALQTFTRIYKIRTGRLPHMDGRNEIRMFATANYCFQGDC